jgi:hypothetical protein
MTEKKTVKKGGNLTLTKEEYERGCKFLREKQKHIPPPRLKVAESPDGTKILTPDLKGEHPDYFPVWCEAMHRATGTTNEELGCLVLGQAITASVEINEKGMNGICAALAEIAPRDSLEGLLAAQMVAVHNQAMTYLKLAARAINSLELLLSSWKRLRGTEPVASKKSRLSTST